MPFYLGAPAESQLYDGHNILALWPGCRAYLFGVRTNPAQPLGDGNVTAEVPVADQASIEVCLAQPRLSIVPNIGVEFVFNGNPGAFSALIQEADTAADGAFITPSPAAFTVIAAIQEGANWVARVDLGTVGSKFLRVLCSANPNAVGWIVKVTMQ